MKCIICGAEMNSTTDGNYTCPICGKEDYYSVYKPQSYDTSLPQVSIRKRVGFAQCVDEEWRRGWIIAPAK